MKKNSDKTKYLLYNKNDKSALEIGVSERKISFVKGEWIKRKASRIQYVRN